MKNASTARPAIYWIRKDLRIADNRALMAAAEDGRPVVPVYIREDNNNGPLGAAQAWWLDRSLHALSHKYETLGSPITLKSGNPLEILRTLARETGSDTVFWNRRYDPIGIKTDKEVKSALREDGFTVESFAGQILHEPSRLQTKSGGPYRVYTPFWKAFSSQPHVPVPLDPPENLVAPEQAPESEALKDWQLYSGKPDWAATFTELWKPGEAGAHKRLKLFIEDIANRYVGERDYPSVDATSLMSPFLALGEISPGYIWHFVNESVNIDADNRKKFLQELVWRDFSYHLLFHAPDLATRNWNGRFDHFEWSGDEKTYQAWTRGQTGYPIVDAGMRQLWREGWMHNRVRMLAASFLIKDLMIDWRRGETWFRDTLVDADPASNAASWQWVAGSGADAAPFFRIFNPTLQGRKFDPDGDYIRRYVPELAKLPAKHIHAPFEAPHTALKDAGVELGKTYPHPLVDHKQARHKALEAFEAIKE